MRLFSKAQAWRVNVALVVKYLDHCDPISLKDIAVDLGLLDLLPQQS